MNIPTFDNLLLTVENNVATLTFNRPSAANGMTVELCNDLMHAATHCDENPDIRAVIVTGAGKFFCAGGDLKSMAGFGDAIGAKLKEMTGYLHLAVSRFSRMDAPLIIAVNGMAAGAGMSFAATGDIVLAAEGAAFTMAYTGAGLSPDGSSTYFLPRLIGTLRTKELMLTNRRLSTEEALEWGLISRIVPADELMEQATKLATQLARGPLKAHGQVKNLLNLSATNSLETQMEIEGRAIAAQGVGPEGQEGITAFLGKRKPDFSNT